MIASATETRPTPDAVTDARPAAPPPPVEHNGIVRGSLFTLAVLATATAVALLGRILGPLVFAVLLYFLVQPVAAWMMRRGLPRWAAFLLAVLALTAVLVGLGWIVAANVANLRLRSGDYQTEAVELAGRVSPGLADGVRAWLATASDEFPKHVAWTVYEATEFGLMAFFYLVFLVIDARHLPGRVRRAYPESADQVLGVVDEIASAIQRYVGVKTIVGLGMGATVAVVLALFGVPNWPLWGFLFFVLNYVTYLGSIVACVPPIALAVLEFDPWTAGLIATLLVLVRFVWIDYVEVAMSGREMNVDPVLLLVAIVFWGYFWGVVGLVLAVPIVTSLKFVLAGIRSMRPVAVLMSER